VYTGIEDIITSPLNDAFEISYNEDDMLIPIKRPQLRPKKQITRQIGQYENFEESGVSTNKFLLIGCLLVQVHKKDHLDKINIVHFYKIILNGYYPNGRHIHISNSETTRPNFDLNYN